MGLHAQALVDESLGGPRLGLTAAAGAFVKTGERSLGHADGERFLRRGRGHVVRRSVANYTHPRRRAGVDALASTAIAAAGWHAEGESPGVRDVSWAIADFLRPAESIGVLEPHSSESRGSPDPLVLTRAGRDALIDALRARALAPAHGLS
ncbi:MAG: hypothetical protein ACRDK9_14540 [Solirubrobacterales bacterium]